MSTTKVLFPYQPPVVYAMTEDGHVLVEQPTGSGKTLMIVAATRKLLDRGERVLIATPQEHIEAGFTRRDYDHVRFRHNRRNEVLDVPQEMIRAARSCGSSSESVKAHLRGRADHALACTHAALTKVRPPTGIPDDMEGSTLIVDEAHHAPALGLAQFVEAWVRAGGRLVYATATAFRSDGSPVIRPGMRVVRRSLPLHMEEKFAPGRLESEIFVIRSDDRQVTPRVAHGDVTPVGETQLRVVETMVRAWLESGRPKTVVRVPPLRGGAGDMTTRLVEAFQEAGARVLDASGVGRAVRNRLLDALAAERALTDPAGSNYDVIIGVQRVAEGLDWPLCSDVYCVGLPRRTHVIVQLTGRATRLKHASHPHGDRARISFFVPCQRLTAMGEFTSQHTRDTLAVCSFLANGQNGLEWESIKALCDIPVARLAEPGARLGTGVVEREYPYIDPALRRPAEVALIEGTATLESQGVVPSDAALLNWVYCHRPDVSRAVVKQVVVEQIVAGGGGSAMLAAERLAAETERFLHQQQTPDVRKAIQDGFAAVALDFESRAVSTSDGLDRMRRQLIALSGQDIIRFASQLAKTRPLTPDWLAGVLREYHSAHNRFPTGATVGGPDGWPDETWKGIDRAIATRQRGWPHESFRGLLDFAQVFVANGTVSRQLDAFARDVNLTDVERRFVDSMKTFRVPPEPRFSRRDDIHRIPWGEVAVVRQRANGSNADEEACWCWMRDWYEQVTRREPCSQVVLLYAAQLVDNFCRWMKSAHHVYGGLPELSSYDKGEVTRRLNGRGFTFRVPDGPCHVRVRLATLQGVKEGTSELPAGVRLFGAGTCCPLSTAYRHGAALYRSADLAEGSRVVTARRRRYGHIETSDSWYGEPVVALNVPFHKDDLTPLGFDVETGEFNPDDYRVCLLDVPLDWVETRFTWSCKSLGEEFVAPDLEAMFAQPLEVPRYTAAEPAALAVTG